MSQMIESLSFVPTSIPHSQLVAFQALPTELQNLLGEDAINIVKAIAILVVGWIVALIVKSIIQGLLNKTDIDNKIAGWVTGAGEKSDLPIEKWAAGAAFWFVILFTIVAVLETLKLDAVYTPLNELLSEVTNFVPQLFGAALWLGVAWLVATIARLIVIKGLGSFDLDKRLNQEMVDLDGDGKEDVGVTETIGNALYWFVFFFFLTPILETLGLESTLSPLQGLVDEVLLILPDLFAAVLIGVVGWFIAQIVRRLVTNLLKATGADAFGAKFGLTGTDGRQSLSWILGTIAYVLVLIPVAISAFEVAQIEAISTPAIAMLDQVLMLLPKILGASIILTFAYVVGDYVSELVTSVLTGFGFDNVLTWLGLDSMIGATPANSEDGKPAKTPSQVMGTVSLVVILLIATLTAVDVLEIEALTSVVGILLAIAGQVLVALLIFALGLYFSNISFRALSSSGTRQSKILGQAARIIILTLVGAMALEQMGIATNIVNLAFGLLAGGIAVAIALAFGFGGKDIAGEQLKGWLDSMKDD
ncbi:Conserved TM helix repeat-containing protein [[Leptolyngbya] sp. PCC 7376]|uniref:mechanosensitive ion channel n=1 Tax=[Leptolyngbya] sp. PCC 7376 TaxID=111781 RepID=UPI00029F1D61|nr:Conserved TM helix repeat-containing protein [[Leptolyngbya] sp. PCC 7376]